jgi:exopolyphosphatase/guanosine-5'-triphosphate,3'-diphosphate pyrophosphatase
MAEAIRHAAPRPPAGSSTVAVIDVGSNTARLVLFRTASSGALRAVDERKEVPRLGSGTAADGSLAPEAIERGVASLARFARALEELGAPPAVGVATSAVRDAPNGPTFLQQVEKATGMQLRILSGLEEARYAYLGVASAWELDNALVCDLGGGSLQLGEVRGGRLQNSVSLPLGVLRMTQRFLAHDPPKDREVEDLRLQVRDSIEKTLEAFRGKEYRIVCAGGTVRALARAAIDLRDYPIARVHGYALRERDLEALFDLLIDVPAAKRRGVAGIGNDRADVVIAGIVVFQELLRAAGERTLTVSGTGIREGIALEAIQAKLPAPAEELALRSVRAAAESLNFSVAHAESVAQTALELFDLLAPGREWGPSERRALLVAAWMHDAGISIDLWRHARHSAYLIRNYPLWGLDPREVLLAAMAAYLHEGDPAPSSWRKEYLLLLRSADLDTARGLGALLQASELLGGMRPKFELRSGGKGLSVGVGDATQSPSAGARRIEKVRKALEREFHLEVTSA